MRWARLLSLLYDLRKIPIHFASMSQMARDASAIVVMVDPRKGVSHGAGHACDTGGTIVGGFNVDHNQR